MNRRSGYLAAAAGFAVLAMTSYAHASAFAVRENSSEGVATAFSGDVSAADSAATAYNNPAGMTELHGNQVEGGAVLVFPTINFHGSATTTGVGPTSGNNGNNGGRPGAAPNFYGVLDLSDQWRVGIAINSPYALVVKNNAGWYGRYLAIDSAVLSTNINPSVAYKVNDQISLGAGASAQWLQGTLSQAVDQAAVGAGDALARFKGDNWGFGYNFGALYKPLPGTQIGAAYRSKVAHKLSGDLDFMGTVAPFTGLLPSGAAKLDFDMPATATFGITQTVMPRLKVSLTAQWTQWSSIKSITFQSSAAAAPINLGFYDTWFTSIGASYQLDDKWTLRAGAGYDQSPVSDRYRTVSIPDNDRYMLGLGFGYKINEALTLDGAYAHYFASNASMSNSINNTDSSNPTPTVLQGSYQLSLDYVSVSLRYGF